MTKMHGIQEAERRGRRHRRWGPSLIAAVLVAAASMLLASPALAAASGWPMFQQSPQHSGQANGAGPASPTVAWTFAPNDGYHPEGAPPIVGSDSTVYVARIKERFEPCLSNRSRESSVVDAVSPQGNLIWQWAEPCGSILRSGMAVASNGTVFAIVDHEALVAIAPGGKTLWRRSVNSEGEVTIGPDGTVYIQDTGSKVYAVNPSNGHVLWTYSPPPGTIGVRGTPTLSPDGSTIYVASGGGALSALTTSGAVKWTLNVEGSGGIGNAPAVGPDGTIYVATFNGSIDAVTPEGTLKWTHSVGSTNFETTPAVGNDGLVTAGDDSGTVVAVKAVDGSVAWTFQAPGTAGTNGFGNSSALIDTSGTAFIQNQQSVFALGQQGNTQWTLSQQSAYFGSSLALDPAAGHLYVATASGLVALSSPASSPPAVTHVEPNRGAPSGGTTVTITGAGFTGATAVKFGATNATTFTVNSSTSITAVSPSGRGTVDVTVTTPEGTSPTSAADQFTFTKK